MIRAGLIILAFVGSGLVFGIDGAIDGFAHIGGAIFIVLSVLFVLNFLTENRTRI